MAVIWTTVAEMRVFSAGVPVHHSKSSCGAPVRSKPRHLYTGLSCTVREMVSEVPVFLGGIMLSRVPHCQASLALSRLRSE